MGVPVFREVLNGVYLSLKRAWVGTGSNVKKQTKRRKQDQVMNDSSIFTLISRVKIVRPHQKTGKYKGNNSKLNVFSGVYNTFLRHSCLICLEPSELWLYLQNTRTW